MRLTDDMTRIIFLRPLAGQLLLPWALSPPKQQQQRSSRIVLVFPTAWSSMSAGSRACL
jgi:hypothetical protein